MIRQIVLLFLIALATSSLSAQCPEDMQEAVAFVTGQWTVVDEQGAILGSSAFRPLPDACGFSEDWQGEDGLRGQARITVATEDSPWRMEWSDSDGLSLTLSGEPRGRSVVFTGTQSTDDGQIEHRISYDFLFRISELRQTWEYRNPGENRWRVFFSGWYIPEATWGQ